METALRPMSLGEILDRTAQLYRENFILFAGIFSVYAGVSLVLNLLLLGVEELLKSRHMTAQLPWVTWPFTALEVLLLFLLVGAAVAAISRAVAWVHLGEPATIRGAYTSILPRLGSYLWLMTITAFVVWTPLVLLYLGYFATMALNIKGFGTPAGVAASSNPDPKAAVIVGIASLLFILLLIPVGVYTVLMSLRYALALPSSVVENLKARQSIRRSIDLSKGSRGRVFVLGLLVGIIKIGFVFLTQFFVFVAAFKHAGQVSPGISALSQVIGFFTNSFLGPIYATGVTLLYYDQRVRKEGFDIEWMMQAAGLTPALPEPATEPAEPWLPLNAHLTPPVSAEPEPPTPESHPGTPHE